MPPAHHQYPRRTQQLHQTASTSEQPAMAAGGLLAAGGHPPACMTVAGNPAAAAGGLPAAGGCFPACTVAAGDYPPTNTIAAGGSTAAGGCSPACTTAADGCAIFTPASAPQHPQQVALIPNHVLAQTLVSGKGADWVKFTRLNYNNYDQTHSNLATVSRWLHCNLVNRLSARQPTPNQSPSLSDRGGG